jgi:hypothetical protein
MFLMTREQRREKFIPGLEETKNVLGSLLILGAAALFLKWLFGW